MVRGRAAAAAVAITGIDEKFLANEPLEKREAKREAMRHKYESVKSRYPKFYPDQEE